MSNRKYAKEFKEEAVKLALEKGTSRAAASLGIPEGTLRTWRDNYNSIGQVHIGSGKSRQSYIDPEKARLIKENKELQRANEILKDALGFFASSQKR